MRVLLVSRGAKATRRSSLLGTLVAELEARGHRCELMLRQGSGRGVLPEGRRAWWLPPVGGWAAARAGAVIRRRGIEVVGTYTTQVARQVLPACVASGAPLVMTVLNETPLDVCAEAVSYASALIVLNRATREYLCGQRPDAAGKVVLLDKPIDTRVFRPAERPPGAGFRVLLLGRLSHTKGRRALVALEACGGLVEGIRGLEVEVVGWGRLLGAARGRARAINARAGREVVRVVGETAHPEVHLRQADVVVGAGFSAAEGLACGCQVVGLGFRGLFGLVTEGNVEEALDLNFGDTGSRWPAVTAAEVAGELMEAYLRRAEDRGWAQRVVGERLAAEVAVGRMEGVFQRAIRDATAVD